MLMCWGCGLRCAILEFQLELWDSELGFVCLGFRVVGSSGVTFHLVRIFLRAWPSEIYISRCRRPGLP